MYFRRLITRGTKKWGVLGTVSHPVTYPRIIHELFDTTKKTGQKPNNFLSLPTNLHFDLKSRTFSVTEDYRRPCLVTPPPFHVDKLFICYFTPNFTGRVSSRSYL